MCLHKLTHLCFKNPLFMQTFKLKRTQEIQGKKDANKQNNCVAKRSDLLHNLPCAVLMNMQVLKSRMISSADFMSLAVVQTSQKNELPTKEELVKQKVKRDLSLPLVLFGCCVDALLPHVEMVPTCFCFMAFDDFTHAEWICCSMLKCVELCKCLKATCINHTSESPPLVISVGLNFFQTTCLGNDC